MYNSSFQRKRSLSVKVRKPSNRSTTTSASESQQAKGNAKVERVEANDPVDQTDRFEVGSGGGTPEDQHEQEQELMAQALEDPKQLESVGLPTMIGNDEITANVESSIKGVLNLVSTESARDDDEERE